MYILVLFFKTTLNADERVGIRFSGRMLVSCAGSLDWDSYHHTNPGWWQHVGGSEVQDQPQLHREFKARVNVVLHVYNPSTCMQEQVC